MARVRRKKRHRGAALSAMRTRYRRLIQAATVLALSCALVVLVGKALAEDRTYEHLVYNEYSFGSGCSGVKDPIGVVFHGSTATAAHAANQISFHSDWDVPAGGGGQYVKVQTAANGYQCQLVDNGRADGDDDDTRNHVRLWKIPYTPNTNNRKTVGTPHHEDWVHWSPWNDCGTKVIGGGHAVDANGSRGSGFDRGRHRLRDRFEAGGHSVRAVNWGNSRNIEQCDGDPAGSTGAVVIIRMDH